jgi:deoxycytidine triphosphate deaminase
MFRAGSFVATAVSPVADDAVQPNGVDLTLAAVLEPRERGRIARDGKRVADRRERAAEDGTHVLPPGTYVVQYAETVAVPEGHAGFVLPRSSLMRNGATVNTAVWDAGYEGRGEGLLQVGHELELERGARIAQFVLAEAGHDATYDGAYQGERTGADG